MPSQNSDNQMVSHEEEKVKEEVNVTSNGDGSLRTSGQAINSRTISNGMMQSPNISTPVENASRPPIIEVTAVLKKYIASDSNDGYKVKSVH